MKTIILTFVLLLSVACGKKDNSGGDTTSRESSNEVQNKCGIEIKSSDPLEVAMLSNKLRQECNLTEDEVIKLIK